MLSGKREGGMMWAMSECEYIVIPRISSLTLPVRRWGHIYRNTTLSLI